MSSEDSDQIMCRYPATMNGIAKWYKKMFKQLGWMVLANKKGYTDKIECLFNV